MATDSSTAAVTNTLSSTTVDTITVQPGWTAFAHTLVVVNWDTTNALFFRYDATGSTPPDPTSEGDDCLPVLTESTTSIRLPRSVQSCVVKVIGNGNKYTVAVLPGPER